MSRPFDSDSSIFDAVQDGIGRLLDVLPTELNIGLTVSPSEQIHMGCEGDEIQLESLMENAVCDPASYLDPQVPLGMAEPRRLRHIESVISSARLGSYQASPLAAVVQGAYAQLGSVKGVKAVILATDGQSACCGGPTALSMPAAGELLTAVSQGRAEGILTFVVSAMMPDTPTEANAADLSAIAVAGGTRRYRGCEIYDDCAYSVDVEDYYVEIIDSLAQAALEAGCGTPSSGPGG